MLPRGMELRPDLSDEAGVLPLGFSGEKIDALTAMSLLTEELIDHINGDTSETHPHLVVVDLRNIGYVSAAALGKLGTLDNRLKDANWKMLMVVDDPVLRDVVTMNRLDRRVKLVGRSALPTFVAANAGWPTHPGTSEHEYPVIFTKQELDEMDSEGFTLDDAIRSIEESRR